MFKLKRKQIVSLYIDKEECVGCESCVATCRRKVLDMSYGLGKFFAVVVYPDDCVGCRKCLNACPVDAIELVRK